MAEAISFRRGNTQENDDFIGVEGEIVVDLGAGGTASSMNNNNIAKSVVGAPTLRFHIGNNMAGGVLMARADMANVHTKLLAERDEDNEGSDVWHKGKNLAYADLSNLEETIEGGARARAILDLYGIAYKDTTNIDTANLVDETIHDGTIYDRANDERIPAPGNKPLAYRDTTNINTADLVNEEIHNGSGLNGNKPLAYRDTTNVNNTDLTNSTIHSDTENGSCIFAITKLANGTGYEINETINTGIEPVAGSGNIIITVTGLDEDDGVLNFTTNYDGAQFNNIPNGWPRTYTDTNGASFRLSGSILNKIDETGNKPLAYRDTSNINTADLANGAIHDGQTPGDKPLQYSDWSNLIPSMAVSKVANMYDENYRFADYEYVERKSTNIRQTTANHETYPTTHAVYSYVNNSINDASFANKSFTNINDHAWDIAAINGNYYVLVVSKTNDGSNYAMNDIIETGLAPYQGAEEIKITVTDITEQGEILSFTTNYDEQYITSNPSGMPLVFNDSTASSPTHHGSGASFTINSSSKIGGELLRTDFRNAVTVGETIQSLINYNYDVTLTNRGGIVVVGVDHLSNIILDDNELISHGLTNGTYNFIYNGTKWVFNNQEINDITEYGISFTGTPVANDQIQVTTTSTTNAFPIIATQDSSTSNNCALSSEYNLYNYAEENGTAHNNERIPMQYMAAGIGNTRTHGLYATKYGLYYKKAEPQTTFTRAEIVATIGYCDDKQNKQNIKVITSGNTITLEDKIAIYQITATSNIQIIIDSSNVTLENNTAKTFEIYLKVGASIPSIGWAGIDHWIVDSEQSPQNPNSTSIFTVRVQKINNVIETVGNYGGEY